jgi:single-strand DNA-binding protein
MNTIMLAGNVASDIVVRALPGEGKYVGTFNLAVDRGFKKDSGTDYFRITVWNGSAVNFEKHVRKGDAVTVRGHVRSGKYDKAFDCGKTHTVYSTEIHADEIMYGARAQRNREDRAATGGRR